MQRQKTSAAQLPALDENTLQQLLGAAWVMQEHNDRLLAQQSAATPYEKNEVLAEIVEMQKLIQSQQFDLRDSCCLVAQGLQRIIEADGIAIGCIEDGQLRYLAALGKAAASDNLLFLPERTLGYEVLCTGRLLQSPNPESDPRIPRDACHRSGAKSLVLVPIFHEQRVKGVLELWFSRSRWLPENDLRLCQLMAGLVTEAMVGVAQQPSRGSALDDPRILLQAVQQMKARMEDQMKAQGKDEIRPLERMAETAPIKPSAPERIERTEPAAAKNKVVPFPVSANTPALNPERKEATTVRNIENLKERPLQADGKDRDLCRGCGHQFIDDEAFCGTCGMTRRKETDLQGKWASLWYMQQAHQPNGNHTSGDEVFSATADVLSPAFKLDPQSSWAPSFKSNRALDELPSDLPTVAHNFVASAAEVASPESDEFSEQAQDEKHSSEKHGKDAVQEDMENIFLDQVKLDQPKFAQPKEDERRPVFSAKEIEAEQDSDKAHEPETLQQSAGGKSSMVLAPWTSAARARSWLESIKTKPAKQEWFVAYRANLYLLIAAVLLLIAFSGWGTRYSPDQTNIGAVSTQPKLNWVETLMVDMGIAVAPPSPDYASSGNPKTQVWLDIHTALYYCPGAALYGQTPGGRFATQKDAQLDQFEPALRQACN